MSLPKKVLPAQFQTVEEFKDYICTDGKFSGEILLDIETLTPLFIGGRDDSKSFAPVNNPIIPGSSLRGMFKNIFKIVTCGAFRGQSIAQKKGEDFNDEHIYFRCIMGINGSWTKSLNDHYKKIMIDKITGKKNARPGFLIYSNSGKYFIAPSKIANIKISEYLKKFHDDKSCIRWDGKRAYIFTGTGNKKKVVRFVSLDDMDLSRDHWLEISDEVLNSYRHDRNRRGVDLLTYKNRLNRADAELLTGKNLSDVVNLIPCHFITDNNGVTAFGHGQCFRIPYKNRITNAVKILGNDLVDFADALFGNTELWSSRVYFEDATTIDGKFSTLPTDKAHPLMQPNPTSYQLYLKQNLKNDELNNWDTIGAQIRGYKLYWHKTADDWQANDFERNENSKRLANGQEPLTKDMTPLEIGTKFKSKIRFKNLSAIELGALMMIFDLDGATDAAYKIGQGKSLGFGSVKIKPTLFIEDDTSYTELFDDNGWQNPYHKKNPAEYLNEFTNHLKTCGMFDIWQEVMDELKKILDCSFIGRKGWNGKVKEMRGNSNGKNTMELDERFKQRVPLQTIKTIFEAVK